MIYDVGFFIGDFVAARICYKISVTCYKSQGSDHTHAHHTEIPPHLCGYTIKGQAG